MSWVCVERGPRALLFHDYSNVRSRRRHVCRIVGLSARRVAIVSQKFIVGILRLVDGKIERSSGTADFVGWVIMSFISVAFWFHNRNFCRSTVRIILRWYAILSGLFSRRGCEKYRCESVRSDPLHSRSRRIHSRTVLIGSGCHPRRLFSPCHRRFCYPSDPTSKPMITASFDALSRPAVCECFTGTCTCASLRKPSRWSCVRARFLACATHGLHAGSSCKIVVTRISLIFLEICPFSWTRTRVMPRETFYSPFAWASLSKLVYLFESIRPESKCFSKFARVNPCQKITVPPRDRSVIQRCLHLRRFANSNANLGWRIRVHACLPRYCSRFNRRWFKGCPTNLLHSMRTDVRVNKSADS